MQVQAAPKGSFSLFLHLQMSLLMWFKHFVSLGRGVHLGDVDVGHVGEMIAVSWPGKLWDFPDGAGSSD